ncbi:MAG: hypothetical protein AAGC78_17230 [Cellvibrio sp.]|uniref:hypothetical protein n=1 Tax=Cellvibrio sp. TaxID=1965322 RepID=UPI0031A3BE0C
MSDLTVDNLTVLQNILLTPASGSQPTIVCAGNDLEISAEQQLKLTPQNGVRVFKYNSSPSLTVDGDILVGGNIRFEDGLNVKTTFKTAISASSDGYGGTPSNPGARSPSAILNGLDNNSLVVEIDGSQGASQSNVVLWWKVNGQKFKTVLVGTPV